MPGTLSQVPGIAHYYFINAPPPRFILWFSSSCTNRLPSSVHTVVIFVMPSP